MSKPIRSRNKWRIRWIDESGNRQTETWSTYQQAHRALTLKQAEIEKIRLGLISPTPADKFFNELCDYWQEKRLPHKRSAETDLSIIRSHLRPAFGHLKIKDVGSERIDVFQLDRQHLDKKTIANILTLLISLLKVAVELNWLIKCPRIRKPKIPFFSCDYRFLKSELEIESFLEAAREEGELVFTLYSTTVFTGLRQGEVAGLKKDDVDFKNRIITVKRSFNGPTKSGDIRYVPILDRLYPLLLAWINKVEGDVLFPNQAQEMHRPADRIFQETLHRVLERANFPLVSIKGAMKRYIVFHDLRHTFASFWMMKGGDIFKLQKILGHKSTQMTQRYAHLAPNAFHSDYDRFGDSENIQGKVIRLLRS